MYTYIYITISLYTILQDWKAAHGLVGKMAPKFTSTADLSAISEPRQPTLKICTMVNGHLSIPNEIRERWLQDPLRSDLIQDNLFSSSD